jgi:hypothetical protein
MAYRELAQRVVNGQIRAARVAEDFSHTLADNGGQDDLCAGETGWCGKVRAVVLFDFIHGKFPFLCPVEICKFQPGQKQGAARMVNWRSDYYSPETTIA